MKIKLISFSLIGGFCLISQNLPSFSWAMEPAEEESKHDVSNDLIKEKLLIVFNSDDENIRKSLIYKKDELPYYLKISYDPILLIMREVEMLLAKQIGEIRENTYKKQRLASIYDDPLTELLFQAMKKDKSVYLDILNSVIKEISDPILQNIFRFIVFKEKSNLNKDEKTEEESIKINYYKTYFENELPESAYSALLYEGSTTVRGEKGLQGPKIVQLALQMLNNRKISDKEKIPELIRLKAIDFNWLMEECVKFLLEQQTHAQGISQIENSGVQQEKEIESEIDKK